jgi:hypothetical protein
VSPSSATSGMPSPSSRFIFATSPESATCTAAGRCSGPIRTRASALCEEHPRDLEVTPSRARDSGGPARPGSSTSSPRRREKLRRAGRHLPRRRAAVSPSALRCGGRRPTRAGVRAAWTSSERLATWIAVGWSVSGSPRCHSARGAREGDRGLRGQRGRSRHRQQDTPVAHRGPMRVTSPKFWPIRASSTVSAM